MSFDCLLVCQHTWKSLHFIAWGPLKHICHGIVLEHHLHKAVEFSIRQSTGFTESNLCTRSLIFYDCHVCLSLWDSPPIVGYTLTGPSDTEHLWRQSGTRESVLGSWRYGESDSREAAGRSRHVWPAQEGYSRNLLTEFAFNGISYDYRWDCLQFGKISYEYRREG